MSEHHSSNSDGGGDATPSPRLKKNGTPAPSPQLTLKGGPSATPPPPGTAPVSTHTQHITQTICSILWGQKLSFHPYVIGDPPVEFHSLWPEKKTLADTYKEAELNQHPYDLVKLLLATNSYKSLDAILDDQSLDPSSNFGSKHGSLAHIACALGLSEVVQSLIKRLPSNNPAWSAKDGEGRIPEEVCVKQELRRLIPCPRGLFSQKNRITVGQLLKQENRDDIFSLATRPDGFYRLINMLNSYVFDVNTERNNDGDLLIHLAIKQGLPQLPLLFLLLNFYKADIRVKDAKGTTPLELAIQLGAETLVEVLVCVCGVDVNRCSNPDQYSPLHVAVQSSQPRIVSILLRRGADALQEDKKGGVASHLARRLRAYECRQIINQHLQERMLKLCQHTISGVLKVSQLYPSDLCAVSSDGCTLIMLAAIHNQEATIRQLLKKGECPLDFKQMKTCDQFDSLSGSMETSWCETKEDKDHTLKTAVHFAAEKGNLGCLQALLDGNAHPSTGDGLGWLPLHYAVDRGHIECVKSILSYPNCLGLCGLKPALDISKGNGFTEISTVLEHAYERRQKELLIPLLFEVASSGNVDQIYHVLENGDDVNPLNEAQDWPLLLTAGFGFEEVVMQLHQFGGHVTKRHHVSKSTPLHVAARGGHTRVVKYLLKFIWNADGPMTTPLPSGMMEDGEAHFVNINSKNHMGATPLELAVSQGHTEVAKLLLEQGASTTLPDSNGRLLSCMSFAGTQFLLETHRKERCNSILAALQMPRLSLKAFRRRWQGPSDFNLYAESNGDNMIGVCAQHGPPDVLKFLLDEAAAVKPGVLISAGELPSFPSCHGSSRSEEDSSDSSLPVPRYLSDSVVQPRSRVTYDLDSDERERARRTALPSVFRSGEGVGSREERLTASGGSSPVRAPRGGGRWSNLPFSWKQSSSSNTVVSSSDEDDGGHMSNGGGAALAHTEDIEDPSELCSGLVRFANPSDGCTALHRASAAGQHKNVTVLLERDKKLANMADKLGNTALHLACNSGNKQTVQALLSFKCIMTTARNKKRDLPEHGSLKANIKKMVCKVRKNKAGTELDLPSPPNPSGITPSMESAGVSNGTHLSVIPEVDLSLTDLNKRLQEMKMKTPLPSSA